MTRPYVVVHLINGDNPLPLEITPPGNNPLTKILPEVTQRHSCTSLSYGQEYGLVSVFR